MGELGDVVTEYADPDEDTFHRLVLPVLDRYSGRELARLGGTDRRTIDRIRGGKKPRPQLRDALFHLAVQQATDDLCAQEILPRDEARWTPPVTILTCWDRTKGKSSSDNESSA